MKLPIYALCTLHWPRLWAKRKYGEARKNPKGWLLSKTSRPLTNPNLCAGTKFAISGRTLCLRLAAISWHGLWVEAKPKIKGKHWDAKPHMSGRKKHLGTDLFAVQRKLEKTHPPWASCSQSQGAARWGLIAASLSKSRWGQDLPTKRRGKS